MERPDQPRYVPDPGRTLGSGWLLWVPIAGCLLPVLMRRARIAVTLRLGFQRRVISLADRLLMLERRVAPA
jgi:hypothetical protein